MEKPSEWTEPKSSAELRERMSEMSDGTTLLAFSRGKDSVATWLALRTLFKRIVPVYYERIPGLEFTRESLLYFEEWFGCRIIRRIHPSFIHQLHHAVFQPYHRAELIASYGFPDRRSYTYDLIMQDVRDELDLPDGTPVANGTRVADSLARRLSFKRHGPVNFAKRSWCPIFDWSHADVADAIERSGIKLPVDYELWGHSFDGLDIRFLGPLRERFPRDYATVLKWFPLAELELIRRELQ